MDTSSIKRRFRSHSGLVTRVLIVCLFLCTINLYGQNQTSISNLVVSPTNPRQGLGFTMSVDIPTNNLQGFLVQGLTLPNLLVSLGSPDLLRIPPVRFDLPSPGTRVTFRLRADAPGWLVIPGFQIVAGGQIFSIPEHVLGVLPPGTSTRVPPQLVWNLQEQTLIQGQSTAVFLELRYMEEYILPESVNVEPLSGGVLEEVSGLGSVTTRTVGNKEFQVYSVASFIITPDSQGVLTFPEASVVIQGQRVLAGSRQLTILPPDPRIAQSGAIGRFTLTAALGSEMVRVGDILRFSVRLEGDGNFNYLSMPEIRIQGGRLASSTEGFRFQPAMTGYRGFRETIYRIVPEQSGNMIITIPTYRWYNPQTRTLEVHQSQEFILPVEAAVVGTAQETGTIGIIPTELITKYDMLELYRRPESYFLLLPPAFIGIGILLNSKKLLPGSRKKAKTLLSIFGILLLIGTGAQIAQPLNTAQRMELISQGEQAFNQEHFSQAYQFYQEAYYWSFFTNPALLYNMALSAIANDETALGIFHLRQANRIMPFERGFQQSLELMQDSLFLHRQHSISPVPSADGFFGIFLVACYLILLFLPFWVRHVGVGKILGLSILLFSAVLSLGGLGFSLSTRHFPEGVVSDMDTAGQMKKIPELEASVWLTLPAGTSVHVRNTSGEFSLVQTSYGIDGWVKTRYLHIAPQDSREFLRQRAHEASMAPESIPSEDVLIIEESKESQDE
jgi:hypothetical protein